MVGRSFGGGAVLELSRRRRPLRARRAPEQARAQAADRAGRRAPRRRGRPSASRHMLVRDVAYQGILKARRADLHARFADWVEREAGERAGEYDEILGYHLERAYRYLTRARPDRRARPRARAPAPRARLGSSGARALARGDIRARRQPARARGLAARRRRPGPARPHGQARHRPGRDRPAHPRRRPARRSHRGRAPRQRIRRLPRPARASSTSSSLDEERSPIGVGRRPDNDVALSWDNEVSRRHAQLHRAGSEAGCSSTRLAQRLLPERRAGHRAAARCATATSCASATRSSCSAPPSRCRIASSRSSSSRRRRPTWDSARRTLRGRPRNNERRARESPGRYRLVSELKARIEAERTGHPFLLYRDGSDQRSGCSRSSRTSTRPRSGAATPSDLVLDWDDQVSRLHALLRAGRAGLDGRRRRPVAQRHVRERRAPRPAGAASSDGDTLRFGGTTVTFRSPQAEVQAGTAVASQIPTAVDLSTTQRRVLVALCRPYKDGTAFAEPGHQPADRRGAVPVGRRRQDPPARAVREVRHRAAAPEPEADPPRRAGLLQRR